MTDTAPLPEPVTGRRYDRYRLWAPAAEAVTVRIGGARHRMLRGVDGWFELPEVPAEPGARYAFRLDDDELWIPDPRSLSQPDGVHRDSEVIDPQALRGDGSWRGRSLRGAVLYEMHVGTFTPGPEGRGGTFDSAIQRLDHLVALGVDAIEVMPVAPFPGDRGWGYDGVGLYATHASYGGPAAFARFRDAAHARGLAVILDVVHNHLGPDGNYLGMLGPYFTDQHDTPWGQAINLDQDGAREVRDFLLGAARLWLVDLGLDGLRLDAVHELQDDSPTHFLAELSEATTAWSRETGRPLTLIAESDRNDPATVTPTAAGGLGMGMQWADDVHHGVHAWITGERQGYYADFGSAEALATVLSRIFLHAGTWSTFREQVWGAPVDPDSAHYDGHSFVTFLQDHDQIGNRATGDRIHHRLAPGQHAAAIALILLGPGTPMLFQGEEWAASSPFTYFTDHEQELGRLVSAGRTEEFAKMGWDEQVPDPQERSTFDASILDWDEHTTGEHARILAWYRRLIELRREHSELSGPDLSATAVEVLGQDTVAMHRGRITVLAHRGEGPVSVPSVEGATLLAASYEMLGPDADRSSVPTQLIGPGALVYRPR